MMNREEQAALERWIERILEAQDGGGSGLPSSAEESREMALRHGLSETQWETLVSEREAHEELAGVLAKKGNWTEAVREYEQVFAIAPYEAGLACDYGIAMAGRFQASRRIADRERAEKLLRHALRLDPANERAVQELGVHFGPARKSGSGLVVVVAVLLAVVLGIFAASLLWRGSAETEDLASGSGATSQDPEPYEPYEPADQVAVAEPAEPPVAEEVPEPEPEPDTPGLADASDTPLSESAPPSESAAAPVALPLSLDLGGREVDLAMEVRSSKLSRYEESHAYEFVALIQVGAVELRSMPMTLELLDEAGDVLVSKDIDGLPSRLPPHLAGDSFPFHHLHFEPVPARPYVSARLLARELDASPLARELEPYPLVDLAEGSLPLPPNIGIELRERSFRATESMIRAGTVRVDYVFSVENTGSVTIQGLVLDSALHDRDGRPLALESGPVRRAEEDRGKTTVVRSHQAAMAPGERRVVRLILTVAGVDPGAIAPPRLRVHAVE